MEQDGERQAGGAVPGWDSRSIGADPGPAALRAFIAIELPGSARTALASMVASLPESSGRAVRWLRPGGIHLTLRFLGNISEERVPELASSLAEAASRTAPFQLALGEPGGFPSVRAARVLWLGLTGELSRLRLLHSRLEGSLSNLGFPPEKRPFSPHLTLGRARPGARPYDLRRVGEELGRIPPWGAGGIISVEFVTLFQSHLGQSGATYEARALKPLGAPAESAHDGAE